MRIAFVLRRFPQLSETFVGDEILSLRQTGLDVVVFSLVSPTETVVGQRFKPLKRETVYAPKIYSSALWLAQVYFLLANPKTYLKRLIQSVLGHWRNPLEALKVLWMFPRAVFFAKVCLDLGDVEHVYTHWLGFQVDSVQTIAALLGVPYSVRLHTRSQVKLAEEHPAYVQQASFIPVVSYQVRDALLAELPKLVPDKVVVIREQLPLLLSNGDTPSGCRSDLAELVEIDLPAPYPLVLAVGRLVEKKGHKYLIQACARLEEQGWNLRCWIVGDGPLRSSLEDEIARLGVRNIALIGARPNEFVVELIKATDIFVQPSMDIPDDVEGVPISVVEAMSAGCAVIATDAGAIPEVVKDGETGLLVPQGDPVTLADALERLFRSPELRREMGKRAQEFVRLEFSPERSTLLLARWFRDSRRDQQTTARAQQSLDWAAAKRQIVDKDRRKRS